MRLLAVVLSTRLMALKIIHSELLEMIISLTRCLFTVCGDIHGQFVRHIPDSDHHFADISHITLED